MIKRPETINGADAHFVEQIPASPIYWSATYDKLTITETADEGQLWNNSAGVMPMAGLGICKVY